MRCLSYVGAERTASKERLYPGARPLARLEFHSTGLDYQGRIGDWIWLLGPHEGRAKTALVPAQGLVDFSEKPVPFLWHFARQVQVVCIVITD
jgi:hypothetical protein